MIDVVQTYSWRGHELPVWHFKTFEEFEHFMETLLPVEDDATAEAWFQIYEELAPEASGVIYSTDNESAPLAVAVIEDHVNGDCSDED